MKDSKKTDETSLDQMQVLQDIILGAEKDRLHKLDWRVSDLESRTADIAEVLPEVMNRLAGDPATQPDFEKPVVNTIRNAIKRDTHSFAEALFPVLGPAIRRAVADALKGLVQRINVALENSFTIKGLRWRLEAARSGVPFAQIVLRHTMIYAIQEAFLIQRGSGLVLASAQRDASLALDEDAVASMLTAIQSFIQDSFGAGTDEPLRSAELGDQTMWVINGPVAILACVISGTPPMSVRDDLMDLLETLHAKYARQFRDHPERVAHNEGLQALMNDALLEEADEALRTSNSFKYRMLWAAGGVLLVAYLLWSAWSAYQNTRLEQQVMQAFSSEPGYVITLTEQRDGSLNVHGLQDPVATRLDQVLENHALNGSEIEFRLRPYQSLDTAIITKRLRGQLGIAEETRLEMKGPELVVNGSLSAQQWSALQALPQTHAIIAGVNLAAAVLAPDEAAQWVRRVLEAPESVSVTPGQGRMLISGNAEPSWYQAASTGEFQTMGWSLDFTPLESSLEIQLDNIIGDLDGQTFLFSNGDKLTDESATALAWVGARLFQAQTLANAIGRELSITLEGLGDGIGTLEKNRQVARDRTDRVLAELSRNNAVFPAVEHTQGPWQDGGLNLERRKVTLRLSREPGS